MGFDITYTYDAVGNRLTKTEVTGATTVVTTYTYDDANRLLSENRAGQVTSHSHDSAGNRTQTIDPEGVASYFEWDALGQMINAEVAGNSMALTYNPERQRVKKVNSDGSATHFLYDHKKLIQETDEDDDPTQSYTSLDDEYGGLVSQYDETDEAHPVEYYHQFDAQRSTNMITDDSGSVTQKYQYQAFGLPAGTEYPGWSNLTSDEWGNMTASQWGNLPVNPAAENVRHTFGGQAGYYLDELTGLYLLGMGDQGRYYDPAIGQFISEDPLRQAGGSLKLNDYVHNNPVTMIDPSGKQGDRTYILSPQPILTFGYNPATVGGPEASNQSPRDKEDAEKAAAQAADFARTMSTLQLQMSYAAVMGQDVTPYVLLLEHFPDWYSSDMGRRAHFVNWFWGESQERQAAFLLAGRLGILPISPGVNRTNFNEVVRQNQIWQDKLKAEREQQDRDEQSAWAAREYQLSKRSNPVLPASSILLGSGYEPDSSDVGAAVKAARQALRMTIDRIAHFKRSVESYATPEQLDQETADIRFAFEQYRQISNTAKIAGRKSFESARIFTEHDAEVMGSAINAGGALSDDLTLTVAQRNEENYQLGRLSQAGQEYSDRVKHFAKKLEKTGKALTAVTLIALPVGIAVDAVEIGLAQGGKAVVVYLAKQALSLALQQAAFQVALPYLVEELGLTKEQREDLQIALAVLNVWLVSRAAMKKNARVRSANLSITRNSTVSVPQSTLNVVAGEGNSLGATIQGDLSGIKFTQPNLPAFNGTTQGLAYPMYQVGDGWGVGFPTEMSSGARTGARFPYLQADGHLETNTALWMQQNGVNRAMVYMNHPGGICPNCNNWLPAFLQDGSQLQVFPLENAAAPKPTWVTVPKTYTGNARSPY